VIRRAPEVALSAGDCALLSGLLVAAVRRERSTEPRVLELVEEVLVLARASRSGSVGTCAVPDRFRSRDGFVSVADAARVLGISERAVRKRCAAGSVRCVKEGGRWWVAV